VSIICPEYLSAQITCADCGQAWHETFMCPIPPEQHIRTRIPTALLTCPNCAKPNGQVNGYWVRTTDPLVVQVEPLHA